MKNKKIILIPLLLLLYSCTSWKTALVSNGNQNDAIDNAIIDFMHTCNLRKTDSIFSIRIYINNQNVYGLSILGTSENKIYPYPNDQIGNYSKRFPSRYKLDHKKLFYWRDSTLKISPEIVEVLTRYNHLDSLMIDSADLYLVPPYTLNESAKGAHYYFCKDDLRQYNKVVTNRGMGTYPPPKLKCASLVETKYNHPTQQNRSKGDYKIVRIKEKDMCHVIYAQKGDSIFKIISEIQYFRIPDGYKIRKGESYDLKLKAMTPSNYDHKRYQIYDFKGGWYVVFRGKMRQQVYHAENLDGLYIKE